MGFETDPFSLRYYPYVAKDDCIVLTWILPAYSAHGVSLNVCFHKPTFAQIQALWVRSGPTPVERRATRYCMVSY